VATKRPGPDAPPASAADPAPRLSSRHWPVLALLAAATSAVFAGVLRCRWIPLDDPGYVYENPHVVHGVTLEGLRWFLHVPHGGNWHPLTSLSHMLDVQMFGLAPLGHHAMSLALHVLNAVLLAVVLHRLTGAWWRSVLVAAFFALHPLRVESVAWISERKDVLSTFFLLVTMEAYRRWVVRPGPGRYATVLGAFALGLMSKPMLVTLPFLLLLLDVWPLGRWAGAGRLPGARAGSRRATVAAPGGSPGASARSLAELIVEKSPLFALAGVSAAITFVVQRSGGAVVPVALISLERRVCNALITCWRYPAKTLWPGDLSVFYPYGRDVGVAGAVLAAAGLAAVSAAALWQVRRRPYLAVGWFWYLGTLVPVVGLVQVGSQAYADRYTYIPVIGLVIALVWGLAGMVPGSRAGRVTAAAASVVALASLAVLTSRQVEAWKDTRTLFTQVLAVTHDNLVGARYAHEYLGKAFLESGQTRLAIPHLEASLGLAPGFGDSLRRVLELDPDDLETRRLLAVTLVREGRVEEAIDAYRWILRRSPDDLDALNNVAWIRATHARAGHRDGAEAVRLAERARDASPEPQAVLYSTLAAAYAESGRFPEAIQACERAIALARSTGASREAAVYLRQLREYRAGRPFHFEG
jgi:protein O-mannosyl-transferase